jgi:hypothetical protein
MLAPPILWPLKRARPSPNVAGAGPILIVAVLAAELGNCPAKPDHLPAEVEITDPAVNKGTMIAIPS